MVFQVEKRGSGMTVDVIFQMSLLNEHLGEFKLDLSTTVGALSLQTIHVMDGFGHRELSGMAWAMTVLSHEEAERNGEVMRGSRDVCWSQIWQGMEVPFAGCEQKKRFLQVFVFQFKLCLLIKVNLQTYNMGSCHEALCIMNTSQIVVSWESKPFPPLPRTCWTIMGA